MPDGKVVKCPQGHADICTLDKCEWYDGEAKCCAVLSIAQALKAITSAPKPAKKGGK